MTSGTYEGRLVLFVCLMFNVSLGIWTRETLTKSKRKPLKMVLKSPEWHVFRPFWGGRRQEKSIVLSAARLACEPLAESPWTLNTQVVTTHVRAANSEWDWHFLVNSKKPIGDNWHPSFARWVHWGPRYELFFSAKGEISGKGLSGNQLVEVNGTYRWDTLAYKPSTLAAIFTSGPCGICGWCYAIFGDLIWMCLKMR